MENYYVLRTDKMSAPHYFAGGFESEFGFSVGITKSIFQAYDFATQKDAKKCMRECGLDKSDWTVSACQRPIFA